MSERTENGGGRAEPLAPWLHIDWQRLCEAAMAGRLPHAILIDGQEGLGKSMLARHLAGTLLCARESDRPRDPCGHCRACGLFQAATHPDYREIAPLEAGKAIRIDQIRALGDFLAQTAQLGGCKLVVINPAERMNAAAANALLKTLEEPTPNTLLVLVSARPSRLPATVRSRCQRVALRPPGNQAALEWLRAQAAGGDVRDALSIASGAPLAALGYLDAGIREERAAWLHAMGSAWRGGSADPVRAAAALSAGDIDRGIGWMLGYAMDIIRSASAQGARGPRNRDLAEQLQNLAKGRDVRWLFARLDELVEARRLLDSPINAQLLLEDLFSPRANAGDQRGR